MCRCCSHPAASAQPRTRRGARVWARTRRVLPPGRCRCVFEGNVTILHAQSPTAMFGALAVKRTGVTRRMRWRSREACSRAEHQRRHAATTFRREPAPAPSGHSVRRERPTFRPRLLQISLCRVMGSSRQPVADFSCRGQKAAFLGPREVWPCQRICPRRAVESQPNRPGPQEERRGRDLELHPELRSKTLAGYGGNEFPAPDPSGVEVNGHGPLSGCESAGRAAADALEAAA